MNIRNLVLTILVGVLALAFITYTWLQQGTPVAMEDITPIEVPENAPQINPNQTAATSSVLLAVLDTDQVSNGPVDGCDKVVMVNQSVTPTTTPVSAALQSLFALSTTSVQGWFNFMANTNGTLQFQSVTISGGIANVYLTGSLSGLAGVCDNPRADIQIKRTALQFPGITGVQLYLNNQALQTLAPNMQ